MFLRSFRSRFRFTRHSDKKAHSQSQPPITPRTHPSQQQAFKFPLLMDGSYTSSGISQRLTMLFHLAAATLSPVPEADDYESSDLSLSDVVIRSSSIAVKNPARRQQQQQPLIKADRKQNLSAQDSQQVNDHRATNTLIQLIPCALSGDQSHSRARPCRPTEQRRLLQTPRQWHG